MQDEFATYELPLHLRLPAPAAPVEPAVVPAKAEEQPETLAAALAARVIDCACEAVAAPAPTPIARPELAVVGQRVSIDGNFGVVIKVNKTHVAMAYDSRTWDFMTWELFGREAFKELTLAENAVAGALFGYVGETVCVAAFLCGRTVSARGDWQLFTAYEPPPPVDDYFAPPPLTFALAHGDHIELLGALLPIEGRKSKVSSAVPPFTFAGLVLGWLAVEKKFLRWALLRSAHEQGAHYLAAFDDATLAQGDGSVAKDEAAAHTAFEVLCRSGPLAVSCTKPIPVHIPADPARLRTRVGTGDG